MRSPFAAYKLKRKPSYLALLAASCLPLAGTPTMAASLLLGNGGNGGVSAMDPSSSAGGGGGIGGGGAGGGSAISGGAGGGLVQGGYGSIGINSAGASNSGTDGGAGGASGMLGGQAGVGGGGGAGGTPGATGVGGSGGAAMGGGGGFVVGNLGSSGGDGSPIVRIDGTSFSGMAGQGAQAASNGNITSSAVYDYVGVGGGGGGAGSSASGGNGADGTLLVSGTSLTVNRSLLLGGAGGGRGPGGIGGRGGDGTLTLSSATLSVADTLLVGGAGGGGALLSLPGGQGGDGTLNIGGYSTLSIGNGARLIVGGGTGGGAGVFNLGLGTADFAGGGAFTINENGTLNIGNETPGATTAGSIANLGVLVNDGRINFNQNSSVDPYYVLPGISGTGSVTVNSQGTTVLLGNSSYTGGTTVSGGTLQVGANGTSGSIAGDVVNNAWLSFRRSDTLDYAGAISGSGNVSWEGSGTLRLTGASNYAGNTYATRGVMEVTGAGARLGSATSWISIGSSADATFKLNGGAHLVSSDIEIGSMYRGTAIVSGQDTSWTSGYFYIGVGGSGELRLLDGAQLDATRSFVGTYSDGVALASGANTVWNSTTGILLGNAAGTRGTLNIQQGATVNTSRVEIGGMGGDLFLYGSDPNARSVLTTGPIILHAGTAMSTVNIDGGILRAAFAEADMFQGFAPSQVTLGSNGMYFDSNSFQTGIGTVLGGVGGLNKTGAGTLTLSGANTYAGGTGIQGGTLSVSSDANLGAANGALTFSGGTLATTASFDTNRNAVVTQASAINVAAGTQFGVNGMIIGTGALRKLGTGTLVLNGVNTPNWNVDAGKLVSDVFHFTANAAIGAAGTLSFTQTVDGDYAGQISGNGTFEKTGTGALSLNADSSSFTGTTRVPTGTLIVTNRLGGNVDLASGRLHVTGTLGGNAIIGNGAMLSGTGTIAQNATLTGATLQGAQGRKLKIGGDLTLDNASRVNVALGTGASNALFDVGGDLALAGTLNVSDQGGFGAGVYRLFDYGGALTSNTLAVGTTPTGVTANDLRLQSAVSGQINLVSTAGATLSFWDGGNAAGRDNGIIDGGSGTWRSDGLNWTTADGLINGRFQPNPTYAVFQGPAGTVSVDTSAGGVGVTGMQIATNGYRIEGGSIALSGGAESVVRVGAGNPADAAITGTIASILTGASKLVKSDAGTLVLAGINSYVGGTEVRGGTLSVSSDANLGAAAGGVTLNGGALATTSSFDTARAVTLTQTADINVAAGTTLGLQGAVGGVGNLQKLGAGTLTLTGANSYGNTQVLAGTLVGNAGSISGDLLNNASVVFNQATDATYAGFVSGTGALVKQGAGVLTLTGVNGQDWRIDAGTLAASATRYTANTTIGAGAQLRLDQTSSTSFDGVLAGAGQFTKSGPGMLQLLADNSGFTGQTQVQAGTLWVSDKLGGTTSVTGGRLHNEGIVGGNVAVSGAGIVSGAGRIDGNATFTGGALEGVQGQTLTIGGDLSLSSASRIDAELGHAPSNALFNVGGNLTLAGTLNVTEQGGFGAGIYRLFDYGGALVNNGLTVGTTPAGVDAGSLTVQTAVGGQVNLASTSGAILSFWDGGNSARHDNGAIDGGAGTWRADGRNWANTDGTLNGVFQPNPTFAVFQGQAGTVTVDASAGAIGITGMQIATDGYRIQGDDIALQGAGGVSIIRVGAGSAASAGVTGTIAAKLTGASKLAKADYGTLILTGNNTYSGGTDVRLGTLSVSQDANLGASAGALSLSGGVLATTASFTANRNVTLAQASGIDVASGTTLGLSGPIDGNGDLTKTGAGTLSVAGDGSAYTGTTRVQAGVLNLASTGKLGGVLTLASGTLLQGAGQVGATTLQSGAVLAPGNASGTLKVAGDLTFLPGSIYEVAADPASSASARVAVSGAANLGGSVVHVGPEGGFESTRQYTILTAGAVNGRFNAVSSNYAYLDPALRYGAQEVTLQLARKQVSVDPSTPTRPIAFADAARTSNQRAVANALDSLPSGNALHEYILTLPAGAPPAAFNSLSGEAHASVASSLMSASSTPRTLPLSHLRANLNSGMRPGAPTAQAGGMLSASAFPSSNAQPAWAELVGNWQTQNATDNSAQVRQHTGGVFAGADHAVGNGWRIGAAVGYTDSKITVDDRASKADVSGYSAAIYGGKSFEAGAGKLNLLVGTSYTWHDVSSERYANVAGASQKLTADYGASTTQLFTELGYAMPLSDRSTLEPFVGLAWSDLRTRAFSESGGSAALRGQSNSDQQTSSTLGVRARTDFTLAGAEARLQATLGWRHAYGDVLPQSTMAFDGGQAFTVSGAPIARNAALAELGAEVAVSRNASLALNYSGQYGGGNREHAGSLNVRWRY
ncbi:MULTISPECIES: autotransporter domain-containing protein [Achromobacter]|uniref:Autotransporter domain-containing protein n=1 Tax=Achromobacter piechaudii TaxID=72556 RepID=A0A6S7DIH7_9BURK|nr:MULTISPECIES: autotransporter domain-containing protein [Achromobacter]MPS78549.1 autotransporter domain-containing protein [Achromobacter sp.]CAB3827036.1 hypothetical protein LMG1861_00560 [Achromobacter piechaudii]